MILQMTHDLDQGLVLRLYHGLLHTKNLFKLDLARTGWLDS